MTVLVVGLVLMLLWIRTHFRRRGKHEKQLDTGVFSLLWFMSWVSAVFIGYLQVMS